MDLYPLDLVLTIAVSCAMIALGTVPTRMAHKRLLAGTALGAAVAWGVIAVLVPVEICHCDVLIGLLCCVAWRKFRQDHVFSGKMWLMAASALGISAGVVVILAVTPGAFPSGRSMEGQALGLASLYLGGGGVGVAVAGYVWLRNLDSARGLTPWRVQRLMGLLFWMAVARATAVVALVLERPEARGATYGRVAGTVFRGEWAEGWLRMGLVAVAGVMVPGLVLVAWRVSGSRFPMRAGGYLMAVIWVGLLAEVLARVLGV